MQLRDSIQKKSKKLLSRTLHSLKHLLLFDGYEKLPRAASFRAFSCASCREQPSKAPRIEESCLGFSGKWTEVEETANAKQEDHEPRGSAGVEKKASVPRQQEEEAKKKVGVGNSHPPPPSQRGGGGGFVLAKKMKELEMMELGDMEHVLDIEEALHYYSRLTSPVYAGIVDQFFMDMYADFTPPPASRTTSFAGRRDLRRKRTVDRSKR